MPDSAGKREETAPRDASTLVVVRDAPGKGIEVFCVERQKVGFAAGAVVFPGGKLDASDLDAAWEDLVTQPRVTPTPIASDAQALRGLAIAACREALEEAAILPIANATVSHADLVEWRNRLTENRGALRAVLTSRGLKLDLSALHPLARWITPVAEPRRFDTRFFLYVAESSVTGAHDDYETTASFWAAPSEVLERNASGELVLMPPTHRTLEVLTAARDASDAVAIADRACLEPICPRFIRQRGPDGDTVAIVLPGDPEHEVRVPRVPGKSRFVLRNGRFLPEDPSG